MNSLIVTICVTVVSGLIVAIIGYYLINIKFNPIIMDNPRIRINTFHLSHASLEATRLRARFNYSVTNEGKNPALKVFIFISKKKIYELGFIEGHLNKHDSFEVWMDAGAESLIRSEGKEVVSFIYRDPYGNWFISEYIYPVSGDRHTNISHAKRIHIWDWICELKGYDEIKEIKSGKR